MSAPLDPAILEAAIEAALDRHGIRDRVVKTPFHRLSPQAANAASGTMLLSLSEVAKELRCSVSTVRRLLSDDTLRAVRPLGTLRVRRTDLVTYINSLPAVSS